MYEAEGVINLELSLLSFRLLEEDKKSSLSRIEFSQTMVQIPALCAKVASVGRGFEIF